ncbi:hypothetical protein M3Y97_00914600 [Aphelenchoides bicaudatus]|nr:hypothetical protein M3Y97_00914600 [Aphelenchoides bicaudatus]
MNISLLSVNPFSFWHFEKKAEDPVKIPDFIEDDLGLVGVVDSFQNRDIQAQIVEKFRQGFKQPEVFIQMCAVLNYEKVPLSKAEEYFDLFYKCVINLDEIDDLTEHVFRDYYELIIKIADEYVKRKNTISVWFEIDDSFRFLTSRYGLRCDSYESGFELRLTDEFHCEEKAIQIESGDFKINAVFRIEVVDSEHVLIFNHYMAKTYNIYFARLDVSSLKCTLLSEETINSAVYGFIFDYEDHRRSFAIVSKDVNDNPSLILGSINKDDQVIIQRPAILFGPLYFYAKRLIKNKLQVILLEGNEEVGEFVEFGEYTLRPGIDYPPFRRMFDLRACTKLTNYYEHKSVWIDNVCYSIGYVLQHGVVFKVDLNTQQITQERHRFYTDGEVSSAYFEDDIGVLSLCIWNYAYEEREVLRFPMSVPEPLQNMTLFSLRKDALFCGSKLYKQLLPAFPSYLQPLAICSKAFKMGNHLSSDSEPPDNNRVSLFSSDEKKQKKKDEKVRRKIRQHYKEGRSLEETFTALYPKYYSNIFFNNIPTESIQKYFRRDEVAEDFDYEEFTDKYQLLLERVIEEFGKLQFGIAIWPDTNDKIAFTFLDSRYAVSARLSDIQENRLFLLDNFHGAKRQIRIEGKMAVAKDLDWIRIECIDSEFMLVIVNNNTHSYVYLLHSNFANSLCTLLSSERVKGEFVDINFDCNNAFRFLLCTQIKKKNFLQLMHIENYVIVSECPPIQFNDYETDFERLEGNKLQGLLHVSDDESDEEDDESDLNINELPKDYVEFKLVPYEHSPVYQDVFQLEKTGEFKHLEEYEHCWLGDTCYLVMADETRCQVEIVKFDLKVRQLTRIARHYLYFENEVEALNISNDGRILTLCATDVNDRPAVYRLLLNSPEYLTNLILIQMHREKKLNKRLWAFLPSTLQPFGHFLSTDEQMPSTSRDFTY